MVMRIFSTRNLALLIAMMGLTFSQPSDAFFNALLVKKRAASTCDTANARPVQNSGYNSNGTSITTAVVNYFGAQTAGNTNIVVISFGSTAVNVSSVTDSAGNSYSLAIGPVSGGSERLYLYYAKNIAASAAGNEVTVTLNAAASYVWVELLEYGGLNTSSPLDNATSGTGSSATTTGGSLATNHACDLLISATSQGTALQAVGANYNLRSYAWGNFVQDRVVSSTGTYTSTATLNSSTNYQTGFIALKKNGGTQAQNSIRRVQAVMEPPYGNVNTMTVPMPAAQTAGNLNVVVVTWFDTTGTVSSVTDTKGNTYTLASGPIRGTSLTQYVYYAKNIAAAAAGANSVSINLSTTKKVSLAVLEYTGLSMSSPLDQVGSATGNSATPSSASVTTTSANELVLGITKTASSTYNKPRVGAGFSPAINDPFQTDTFIEERVVSSTGTYSATATFTNARDFIFHIVTFK